MPISPHTKRHRPALGLLLLLAACEGSGIDPTPVAPKSAPSTARAVAPSGGGSVNYRGPLAALRMNGFPTASAVAIPPGTIRRVTTIFNTDYVSAGVGGLRDVGSGNITLAGVSGSVSRALLYWHGPTSIDPNASNGLDANANVKVNGVAVRGTNIGLSSDNCWGYANSMAYVADITALVRSAGNGVYQLTQFGSGLNPLNVNTNGASLVVFFNDANNANNRDVVLYEGNDSNINNPYDAPGWNVTLDNINYKSGSANMQLHVADGQAFPDDAIVVNGNVLIPVGPNWNGNTVPSANNGPGNNGSLWDIRTFGVTSLLTPGNNTLSLTSGVVSDCLSLVVATVDLPAGAAPTPPIAFVPGTISLSKTGTVTVYLYSTATFDATQADPAEVRLLIGNVLPGAPVARRGTAYLTGSGDYNGDGRTDKAFVFTMADLRAAGLTTSSASFALRDATAPFVFDGRPVTLPTIVP